METQTKTDFKKHLEASIIETFAGNTYSCLDYSNDEDFIYFDFVQEREEFTIGSSSIENIDMDLLFEKFKNSDVFPTKEFELC